MALTATCPHDCPSVCALEFDKTPDGRLGRVRGNPRHRYTDGVICAKVARYAERMHHPDRLMQPLARVGAKNDGRFSPIGWDEALDRIAEAFLAAEQRHGPAAVWPYYYAGTMGLVQRDGINRLRHAKHYSGQDDTICTRIATTGWNAGAGKRWGVDACEIPNSEVIVLWGLNAVSTQIQLKNFIAQARRKGARLVVVDPYLSPTAKLADMHLPVRPGTDGALACAVMHVLFAEGFADWPYLERYTDVPHELARHVRTRTPEWASAITGLAPDAIRAFARLYGSTKRSYVRLGFGFTRSRNGSVNMHAASCLPAVTGAWQVEGGGALYNQGDLFVLDATLIQGLDVRDPSVRMLDMSAIGRVLTGDEAALQGGPQVTAMLVQNVNPACVTPELDRVHAGLGREDLFVAVHEQFMTDTARFADLVLPATMFLEHDDIYRASGHTILQVSPQHFDAPGECRENHWVVSEIARRIGAEHRGFAMSARELVEATLALSNMPDFETILANDGYDLVPDFRTAHFLDGFPTSDGRFHFAPDWAALGADAAELPRLPDHSTVIDDRNAEHPFRLVAGPAREFLNTSFTETPTSRRKTGRPTLLVHPDDADALAIGDGDPVRIGNRLGSVLLHAERRSGGLPGTVTVESIWPNAAFVEGIGINRLISADPARPARGAVFHDTAVWLRREPEVLMAAE
ncbi:MAG: molybdopterin-dependent oxidoreductase [Pseudomonadota bacterium]